MGSSSSTAAGPESFTDTGNARIGDLIEISRPGYQHWAIYVGNGYVVHFVGPDASVSGSTVPKPGGMSIVLKEKLVVVAAGNEWRVNNSLDERSKPRPVYDIVKDACSWVDVELSYNVLTYNCEHFVHELRYGKPESGQVRNAVEVAEAVGIWASIVSLALAVVSRLFASARRT